jgi:hypothetical protein
VLPVKLTEVVDPIGVPDSKNMVYEFVHVQVPTFSNFQVFVNVAPGSYLAPSGTVTSATNRARSVHVCAAEALAGIAAAGTNDSVNAMSTNADTACNLDFMASSSGLSSY